MSNLWKSKNFFKTKLEKNQKGKYSTMEHVELDVDIQSRFITDNFRLKWCTNSIIQ